jgi:DNA-directed RNA polymerase subunit H
VLRSVATIRDMLYARRGRSSRRADEGGVESAGSTESDKTAFELTAGDAAAIRDAAILEHVASGAVFHVDLPGCGVRLVYDLNPKFKMVDVRALLTADPPGTWTYILVVRERPVQGKGMELVRGGGGGGARDVQLFLLRELQFNLMRHALQPDFEPIREEAEIKAVMKRYGLKSPYQLPLILSTDPVARHLALKPGQLVRILRPSPSAGTCVQYRCCQR